MIKLLSINGGNQTTESNSNKKIEYIPVDLIRPNPYQPRKQFPMQSLEELAQSIKQYGVLQPITVRKSTQEGYELIAGERRLRAAKLAGLENIPAIVINAFEQDSAIMAMIENLQRENLHFLEEAKGYASLIQDHGFTQEELAIKLGKNQSTIANKLRILRLSPEIKDILVRENLTERHARALLKLPDEESRLKALKQVVEKNLNVKDTEAVIESYIQSMETEQSKMQSQESKKSKNKRKRIFGQTKDIRIFVNTIKNAVNILKNYGLTVQYTQVDKGDSIEITVSIPKE
ncbi:MAG TPA: nucleoid occlusion protein [Clostridiales bacterium]|nr:nucleoid occlusion protein [Clostridiales bacterium]